MDPKFFDDLAKKLADSMPQGLRDVQADVEKNFHVVLQNAFSRLNLVTREEFEAQAALLVRTREKLDALEVTVKAMEAQSQTGVSDQ